MPQFIDDEAAVDMDDELDDELQHADGNYNFLMWIWLIILHTNTKTDTGFIDDEDAAIDQYPFPSDNRVTNFLDGDEFDNDDDEETISRFYDNLLARASKNANRPSYNRKNDETIFDELIRCQFRTDDYPLWKIRCKVRRIFF